MTDARIRVLDELVPPGTRDDLCKAAATMSFRCGWRSVTKNGDPEVMRQSHWHHEIVGGAASNEIDLSARLFTLADDPKTHERYAPVQAIWELLQPVVGRGAALLRCYVNAHTFGTEGYPHTDSDRAGEFTAVVYGNAEWRLPWGGETAVYEGGEIVASVMPRPGRVVLFPSEMLHCARSVSRVCTVDRRTLVLKARP